MATAKQSGLSPLAMVEGDEEQQKFAEVQRLQQQLKDALDVRKGFYLDPTMLALAQGFATPTRTGSFFESAGIAAGRAAEAQEAERKRAQEIAQMRLEIAMGELGLQQQQRQAKQMSDFFAGRTPGVTGAPSAEIGAPAVAGSMTGAPAAGGQAMPKATQPQIPTQAEIEAIRVSNPRFAEAMERQRKSALDAIKVTDTGVTILTPGQGPGYRFEPRPGRPTVERFQPGVGTLLFTENDAKAYDEALDDLSRNPSNIDAQKELNRLVKKVRGEIKTTGPSTPAEAEVQKKYQETTETERAKAEQSRTQTAITGGQAARDRIPTYQSLAQFARDPDADKIFGIFANSKVSSAIAKIIQSKAQLPLGMSIEIPELEEALRNVKIPPNLIAKAQAAAALMANAQLFASKVNQGQGAVSDFERRLYGTSSFSMSDRKEAIIYKAARFEAAAIADQAVANALTDNGMTIDKFRKTKEYDEIRKEFDRKIKEIDAQFGGKGGSPRPVSPSATVKPYSTLRGKLGIPEKD